MNITALCLVKDVPPVLWGTQPCSTVGRTESQGSEMAQMVIVKFSNTKKQTVSGRFFYLLAVILNLWQSTNEYWSWEGSHFLELWKVYV